MADPAASGLIAAKAALQAGEADKALALLNALTQPDATSAEAHNLKCRVFFTLEQWDAAVTECQQAASMEDRNSDYHLWLGRALGEKADKASFVQAYSLAKRARLEFEQAVQLDSHNAPALADLGEFYNEAPGVVGGGIAKAQDIAALLDHIDQVRAHELRGFIADGNKDVVSAEREFRQALAVSAHPAYQWMELASFYRRRQRWPEMESALQSGMNAAQRDHHAGDALYNGATVLAKANRDPNLEAKMLQTYLAGPEKTEEAPAFVAHVLLAHVMAQLGDTAAAWRERGEALSLAAEYQPAQNLKF